MEVYSIKRGDTFKVKQATWLADDGQVLPLVDVIIQSQIRTKSDQIVKTLTINISGNNFSSSASDTSDWPLGDLLCDIEFTKYGVKISSETFIVRVEKDITNV
jgi:hypothetical protein